MGKRKTINWKAFVAEHQRSGKSVAEFCKEKGIHPNTFYSARKKCKHEQEFVEIKVTQEEINEKAITLHRKGFEISLEPGFCVSTLKKVLTVLG